MPLSCYCEFDDGCDWYWKAPQDYQLLSTKRSRRCCSCKKRIAVGDLCAEFLRTRYARTPIEKSIYGEGDPEEINLASYWHCEECADIWFSLDELGFHCVAPGEDVRAVVREYAQMAQHKDNMEGWL